MKVKAISLKQPWASYIGAKTIETRKWKTAYRGPLLIVSSTKIDRHISDFTEVLAYTNHVDELPQPVSAAVAICWLTDIRPMTEDDELAAMCECYPKAQAWILEDIQKLNPWGVKGRLGVYDVDIPDHISPEIDKYLNKRRPPKENA